ncbi:MAG: acyltransferase, partial [Moraxella osloensis]|nr:acyltransferase [Moraxella osloensis]
AQEKWLLHTWSLAVEAQFYVLYPIFVALMWRFWAGLKALTLGLLVLFVASLALNLVATFWQPTAAFYLLPTRGWELAAGGLVYLIARQDWVSAAIKARGFWLGWILVIGSFAFIEESFAWPGYWAILPVLGASLIILGQRETCFLTDNAVAQWLGDRSYSLYLWHWPLVVALYFAGLQSDWAWVLGFLTLSLLLAHLSYRFVEVPTRSYLSAASLRKEILAIAAAGAVIGMAAVSVKLFVFDGRVDSKIEIAANEAINRSAVIKKCTHPMRDMGFDNGCNFGEEYPKALVIGDSHADALIGALIHAGKSHGDSVFYRAMYGCPSIRDAKLYTSDESEREQDRACKKFNSDGIALLEEKPKNIPIVLINRFSSTLLGALPSEKTLSSEAKEFITKNIQHNKTQLTQTLCELSRQRNTFTIRPIPEMGIDVPKTLSRNIMFGRGNEDIKITLEA